MDNKQLQEIIKLVRTVPDFPIPTIQFKDLTTVLKDPEAFRVINDRLAEFYAGKGITKVVGIEARGFICGAVLADRLHAGFVPLRKPGKLPADTLKMTYKKEYGIDAIEIHRDAITPDDVVLIHDDLLATGGTMLGACKLVMRMKPKKIYVNFLCHLKEFDSLDVFPDEVEVMSLFEL